MQPSELLLAETRRQGFQSVSGIPSRPYIPYIIGTSRNLYLYIQLFKEISQSYHIDCFRYRKFLASCFQSNEMRDQFQMLNNFYFRTYFQNPNKRNIAVNVIFSYNLKQVLPYKTVPIILLKKSHQLIPTLNASYVSINHFSYQKIKKIIITRLSKSV